MDEATVIDRANCPGCGAPLPLDGVEAIITCPYCGSDSKVIRRLRAIEPDLPLIEPPDEMGDPAKDYASWSTEQLLAGLQGDASDEDKIEMAKALDCWPRANEKTAAYVPFIIETMLAASEELDGALKGILGKLICEGKPKLRLAVIDGGRKYGFGTPGSKGLLWALSLGDAGSVKLLLDIAEWADSKLADEYAKAALVGVQTAIGREKKRRTICVQILLHRYIYVSPVIQNWITRFLRNHFDVGYVDVHDDVITLIEDCSVENAALIPRLVNALRKCGKARTVESFRSRIEQIPMLKSEKAILAACESLGRPCDGVTKADLSRAIEVLTPLCADDQEEQIRLAAEKAKQYFNEP